LQRIFSCAPQLKTLRAIKSSSDVDVDEDDWIFNRLFITWATFEALANIAGSTICALQDVSVIRPGKSVCPSIFGRFLALRRLQCGMFPHFKSPEKTVKKYYLSTLESIQLWACHSSFLDILTMMEYVIPFFDEQFR
jgi:hypothetical protein